MKSHLPDDGPPVRYPRSQILWLSCGCHVRKLRSEPYVIGDDVYCGRHQVAVTVVRADGEWKTRCVSCRGGRKSFGLAKYAAQRFADRHQQKHPDHKVQVMNGDIVVEIRVPRKGLETLPFEVDTPPY